MIQSTNSKTYPKKYTTNKTYTIYKTYPSSHSSASFKPVSASYLLQPANKYYNVPSQNVQSTTESVIVDPVPKVPQNQPFPTNPDIPIVIPKTPQDFPEGLPEDFDPELAEIANFLDIFPSDEEGEEFVPVALPNNVVEVISKTPNLSNLATLVKGLKLVDTLSTAAQVTVLAPSDQAFTYGSTTMLKDLQRHVIGVKLTSDSIETGPVATLSGDVLNLVKDSNNKVTIEYNGKMINVVKADISASNGVIHVIDQVIQ